MYIDEDKQIQKLLTTLKKLNKVYNSLPEGHISISHAGDNYKWFHSTEGGTKYLKKCEVKLAKKLAIKKYLKLKIAVIKAEIRDLSKAPSITNKSREKLYQLLSDPAYLELLSDFLSQNTLEAAYWMKADYPKNQKHPESLVHPTVGGIMVRSKSESMIAMALAENNIPFRYENLLTIGNITIAPDFTLLHPVTKELYYWEHFGMIDNEKYYESFASKIQTYAKANIILGDNLIASFETSENPLSYNTINNILKQYFY